MLDQSLVTSVIHQLEKRLEINPYLGQTRQSSANRVVLSSPVGIWFDIIEDDKKVLVLSVWLITLRRLPEGTIMPTFHLSTFSADVTPPLEHPLCGGWIEPVRGVDDPLRAAGIVLLGMGKPIVVLRPSTGAASANDAFSDAWRTALAEAAHTTPDHVAVQTVHPHNAPFADIEAPKTA